MSYQRPRTQQAQSTESDTTALEQQFASLAINVTGPRTATPTIKTFDDLGSKLPVICNAIFETFGPRYGEAVYQGALEIDLKAAGVVVLKERRIPVIYKGIEVSSRRADMALRVANGTVVLLELKAVQKLASHQLQQLEYYMAHYKVEHGYLINFQHVGSAFPDDHECIFATNNVQGDSDLSDRRVRAKELTVDIVKVTKIASGPSQQH
ncbi:hypothetical protein HDU81_010774 [Chytriomyces hyalinus]|nr:hypothetical protein HDU81_010774 [Chytriomyces hyalinus]